MLIIESDLPLSIPDVELRRPANLTDADRQKLKNQGISSDELNKATIISKDISMMKEELCFEFSGASRIIISYCDRKCVP